MSAGKSEVARYWLHSEDIGAASFVKADDYAALESLLLDARAEVERLESELAGSIAQAERMMAYMITHDGAALYCSSAMRDAYSEEHHGRLRAEALTGEAAEIFAAMDYGKVIVHKELHPFQHEWTGGEECDTYSTHDPQLVARITGYLAAIDAVGGRGNNNQPGEGK